MKAGRLNNRVTIQQPGSNKDAYGHATKETWADVVTVWAEVKPVTGRERWASDHVANTSTVAIKIRYRTGIKPEMRVIHGSHTYQIDGPPIDVDGRRRELVLACKEVTT